MTAFVTPAEVRLLIQALERARGGLDFAREEAERVVEWAEQVRIEDALLRTVLRGDVVVDVREDGELIFTKAERARARERAS